MEKGFVVNPVKNLTGCCRFDLFDINIRPATNHHVHD